ncbi:MAG: hypothetical protein WC464_06715 [Bdellovibrionales bacterium]
MAVDNIILPDAPGVEIIDPFWSRPDLHAALGDSARGILEHPKLQNTDILSIGESPALLSLIAKDALEARGNSVTLVPFSGFRFTQQNNNDADDEKTIRPLGNLKHLNAYRAFLEKNGASPRQIVEKFKGPRGTKTAIFDIPSSYGSLGAFYQLMLDWAKDEGVLKDFERATELVAITESERVRKQLHFPAHGLTKEPLTIEPGQIYFKRHPSYPDTRSVSDIMLYRPGRDEGAENGGFRIVPYHSSTGWDKDPVPIEADKAANAARVLAYLAPIGQALKADQLAGIQRYPATIANKDKLPKSFYFSDAKPATASIGVVGTDSPEEITAKNLGKDIALVAFDGTKASMVRIAVGKTSSSELEKIAADLSVLFDPAKTTIALVGGRLSPRSEMLSDLGKEKHQTSHFVAGDLRTSLRAKAFNVNFSDLAGRQANLSASVDETGKLCVVSQNLGAPDQKGYSVDLEEWLVRRQVLEQKGAPEAKVRESVLPLIGSESAPKNTGAGVGTQLHQGAGKIVGRFARLLRPGV